MGAAPSAWTPRRAGGFVINPSDLNSLNPFQSPAILQPSPTDIAIQSGTSHCNCSQISNATVFLPSTRYGLIPELRLYHPKCSAASILSVNASSYVPLTTKTSAPNMSSWASFASGILSGTNIHAFIPAAAAFPARLVAALPVEEQVAARAPLRVARATPTELARSFKLFVGLRPSSFSSSVSTSMIVARRFDPYKGVHPTRSGGRGVVWGSGSKCRYRQWSEGAISSRNSFVSSRAACV